jgi:branched-chain amino acid transport system ATP-binding protein
MSALLDVSGLSVSYGRVEAVVNVSLEVGEGQIVTIIGPNGAGKTSLLSAIMGLVKSSGGIRYDGQDLRRLEIEDRLAEGLCLVPEQRELFGDMSVADNLVLGAYLYRHDAKHLRDGFERVYGLFPRLAERRTQIANTLSGGERQMLALGRALMAKPRLLMLDEPSLGLAPLIVREIFRIISSLRDLGVSVLLVEQNARAALETADFGYVLETGEVGLSGPASRLINDPQLAATYLGGHA